MLAKRVHFSMTQQIRNLSRYIKWELQLIKQSYKAAITQIADIKMHEVLTSGSLAQERDMHGLSTSEDLWRNPSSSVDFLRRLGSFSHNSSILSSLSLPLPVLSSVFSCKTQLSTLAQTYAYTHRATSGTGGRHEDRTHREMI